MRFFVFHHGRFRRIGLEATIGGVPRRLDFTRGWEAWVNARRLSLPTFPDLWDLLSRELWRPELVRECVTHLDGLPPRTLDELAVATTVRYSVPVPHPLKLLCLARNYAAHAAEMGGRGEQAEPGIDGPMFFAKLPSSLIPHGTPIRLPAAYPGRVDHEVELAAIIARKGANIPEERALEWVAGFTVFNDVTHRDLQGKLKAGGQPWTVAKSFDTFGPCGPYFVLPDELADFAARRIRCTVNGELRQDGTLGEMVVSVPAAIAAISRLVTLGPGDLIATGTPAGVGPLRPGDTITCTIDGIGNLTNPVVAE